MKNNVALIFGYNDYTLEIEKNIRSQYEEICIFTLSEDGENSFDLSDNWDSLSQKVNMQECTAFCILEDMAENIFLCISLRDTFSDLPIIALSEDEESQNKLMLAGATNVLPTMRTTANVIVEMLEKPKVTEMLHDILYEKSSLKIAQVSIENESIFNERSLTSEQWNTEYGIIIMSLILEDGTKEFIYSSNISGHTVKNGEVLVVIGYEVDIKNFEKLLGKKYED